MVNGGKLSSLSFNLHKLIQSTCYWTPEHHLERDQKELLGENQSKQSSVGQTTLWCCCENPDFCSGTNQTKRHSSKISRTKVKSLHLSPCQTRQKPPWTLRSGVPSWRPWWTRCWSGTSAPPRPPVPDSSWPEVPARVRLSAELLPFFYREIAYLAQGNLCNDIWIECFLA